MFYLFSIIDYYIVVKLPSLILVVQVIYSMCDQYNMISKLK